MCYLTISAITIIGSVHRKKGYSGVAVFTKIIPDKIEVGNGHGPSDDEGRIIQLDFKDVRLINAYFPSGTSGDIRQTFKYHWLDEFYKWLDQLKRKHPKLILCGDYNIAHKEIDIMIQKAIKIHQDFYQKKENGWINFWRMVGRIHSVNFTLSLIDIAGGVSVSLLFVCKIKDGELII
jgi:exodeoxyribonuclease-3